MILRSTFRHVGNQSLLAFLSVCFNILPSSGDITLELSYLAGAKS